MYQSDIRGEFASAYFVANFELLTILQSDDFWIIANAIRKFWEEHEVLPLSGSLPDMKARSHDYVALQRIYKEKARKDFHDVSGYVRETEQTLGRSQAIPEAEIELFCRNSKYVKVINGRRLLIPSPKMDWKDRANQAADLLEDETSLFLLHIAFMAFDLEFDELGHAPRLTHSEEVEQVEKKALAIEQDILAQANKTNQASHEQDLRDLCKEM